MYGTLGRVLGTGGAVRGDPLQAVKPPSTPRHPRIRSGEPGSSSSSTSPAPVLASSGTTSITCGTIGGMAGTPAMPGGHRRLPRTPAALPGGQDFCCPSQARVRLGCQTLQPRFGGDPHAPFPCRQCCSGKELVDWLLSAGLAIQTRSQAVGVCQVLVDGGVLTHGEGGRWQPPAPPRGLARRDGAHWGLMGSPMGARGT